MMNAAREASRSMAVQALTSGQAQSIAANYLTTYPETFSYSVVDGCSSTPKGQWADVTVTITTGAAAASIINYLNMFTGKNVTASVTMRKELAC